MQELHLAITELDNAVIRKTNDGKCSVYDLITVIAGQRNPRKYWERLTAQYPEVVAFCYNFRFSGQGQRPTPVTDREGWAYILGLLPNIMGKKYREEAARLVVRYLDNDITLADEIVQKTNDQADLEWLGKRVKAKEVRNQLTGIYRRHGVIDNGYAQCTNMTYQGLFKATAKQLKARRGLSEKANWRDHATTDELADITFAESLTGRRIVNKTAQGNEQCADIAYDTASQVAEFTQSVINS